jgi:hypothetical protein
LILVLWIVATKKEAICVLMGEHGLLVLFVNATMIPPRWLCLVPKAKLQQP